MPAARRSLGFLGLSALLGAAATAALALPASGPPPGFQLKGTAKAGQPLYAKHCASCHGERGEGDGPRARSLRPPPTDFTDLCWMQLVSDWSLYVAVHDGGLAAGRASGMKGWKESMSEQQIHDVVAFVRTLATPRPDQVCPDVEGGDEPRPPEDGKARDPPLCPRTASLP